MMITSNPTGAKVILDQNKHLGRTPILLQEHPWVWTTHRLSFTHQGYRPATLKVEARARPELIGLTCFGTVTCCLWPMAFAGRLPPSVHATMTADRSVDPFEAVTPTSYTQSPEINFE